MKIKSIASSILLSLAVFFAATIPATGRAAQIAPSNSSESVMFAAGRVDGEAEALEIMELAQLDPGKRYSFRLMAQMAMTHALMFRSTPAAHFYFLGRAAAFNAVADLMGE